MLHDSVDTLQTHIHNTTSGEVHIYYNIAYHSIIYNAANNEIVYKIKQIEE